jgi:alkyl sulfatase BDS1-like metallo-beta-lactamase superfamily hydrolase
MELAERVVDFYQRNDKHLAPWDPPKPKEFCTAAFQSDRLVQAAKDAEAGSAMRWWLCLLGRNTFASHPGQREARKSSKLKTSGEFGI